jgi:TusA-related sulfurtransferase
MGIGFLKKKEAEELESDQEFSQNKELRKLKKSELLEIMLKQGEEIDSLRARVKELEAEVAEKQAEMERHEFEIKKFGSIAEASLQVTNIFQEAEKAAKIYLENLRRRYG